MPRRDQESHSQAGGQHPAQEEPLRPSQRIGTHEQKQQYAWGLGLRLIPARPVDRQLAPEQPGGQRSGCHGVHGEGGQSAAGARQRISNQSSPVSGIWWLVTWVTRALVGPCSYQIRSSLKVTSPALCFDLHLSRAGVSNPATHAEIPGFVSAGNPIAHPLHLALHQQPPSLDGLPITRWVTRLQFPAALKRFAAR